jgi:hypothetical protein
MATTYLTKPNSFLGCFAPLAINIIAPHLELQPLYRSAHNGAGNPKAQDFDLPVT